MAGRLERITSYSHPFPKTGSIVNEVLFEYNDPGLPIAEYQSHSGAVDMVSTPKVQYAYDETAESGELVKGLRPTQLIYPNGRIVRYEYAEDSSSSGTGDDPDDLLNRIKFIADDDEGAVGTHLAEYTRLGLNSIVQVDYTEPGIRYDLAHGAGDDPYDGLDRFGRVIDLLWHNYNTAEDVVRIKHGYDRAGNRLYREDPVAASHGVDMDEAYTYDGLYQLKTFTRGALNAQKTAIAAPTFRQSWAFDATGNWAQFHEDTDGDGKWELEQSRQHNAANEITAIGASIGDLWISPTHDRNGNMLRIPQPNDPTKQFTLKWDAWNRLVRVSDADTVIAEYAYDARNFRVVKRVYRDPSDPLSTSGTPLRRHFYYNGDWQCLEERASSSPAVRPSPLTPHCQFVWGVRYIDDLILRNRDTSSPANGALNERIYALQDGNWNVTALTDDAGQVQERCAYNAYGEALTVNPATLASRSSSLLGNRHNYTGRRLDDESGLYYHRARYYDVRLGRFVGKDPIGYFGGDSNLYRYVRGGVLAITDPMGLRLEPPDARCKTLLTSFRELDGVAAALKLVTDCPRIQGEQELIEDFALSQVAPRSEQSDVKPCPEGCRCFVPSTERGRTTIAIEGVNRNIDVWWRGGVGGALAGQFDMSHVAKPGYSGPCAVAIRGLVKRQSTLMEGICAAFDPLLGGFGELPEGELDFSHPAPPEPFPNPLIPDPEWPTPKPIEIPFPSLPKQGINERGFPDSAFA